MRSVLVLVAILLAGCNNDSITNPAGAPQPPIPGSQLPPGSTAAVAGYVYSQGGACLVGAVVEVVDGTKAGLKATQEGCGSPWDEPNQGYFFELDANKPVKLRASKQGFQTRELTAIVDNQHSFDFVLAPESLTKKRTGDR